MSTGPDDLADLTPELRAILNSWDPFGVAMSVPDEYDGLNGLVLGCLARSPNLATFSECFVAATDGFCHDPAELSTVAARIFAWSTAATERPGRPSSRAQLRKGRRWRSSHWKT